MVTALGFNAPSTFAALQAGISGVTESAWTDFESGEPLKAAKVQLPHWWEGTPKYADLLAPAIEECLFAVDRDDRRSVPLLIGTSSTDRSGRPAGFDQDLFALLHSRLDLPINPYSEVFPFDQIGCARALLRAQQCIENSAATRIVVAGVDSFLSQRTLDVYINHRRLMTPTNSNGFFPGEAGCAVLIGAAGTSESAELMIHGHGFAVENATITGTDPMRATGLTIAMRQALKLASVGLKDVAYRLTDLSGEHYKFKEAAFAAGRLNSGDSASALQLWHPIEFLGEIGAAILPCLLAQALDALQQSYAPGPLALCHVGNDAGERAAFVVGP